MIKVIKLKELEIHLQILTSMQNNTTSNIVIYLS